MAELMKNIKKSKVLTLKDEISYADGQVVSKTLVQNDAVSETLFAFEKGEEISTHESGGEMLLLSVLTVSVLLRLTVLTMNLLRDSQSLCRQNTLMR